MPTGGGKSLCYQIPAFLLDGLCLVVSPLVSLMKDQVQQLNDRGIKARLLISGMTGTEQEIIYNNCRHGMVKILYVSPERLGQSVFRENMRRMKISFIAVDEAHCISQWGYEFRPSYLQIARIRDYHPQAPIIALTATATQAVAADIQRQLMFRSQSQLFQTSFQRPNLAYMVFRENDKMGRMVRIVQKVGGSGIVYVRNRRRTKEIASFLVSQGIPAAYYHAGLDAKERDIAQYRWMRGEVNVIVATNAFGMGIDKPDVRYVVHMDIPSSVEAYFQEAGRAGRDGKKSFAVLLYEDQDLKNLQFNFDSEYPSRQQIANIYRAICNYYQIPVGSGENCIFDFDMDGICQTYNIKPLDLYSACRFLEREGLLSLPEKEDASSSIYISISREDLYRFQVEQARYCDLIALLIRMYGGLFTEYVPISERAIAKRMYMDEEHITRMLLHIDALQIIHYKPRRKNPSIIFSAPRIDAKDLYLSDANYKDLKESARTRLDAIRQYVTSSAPCRSQQLLSYFGEQNACSCGVCDYCLQHKSAPRSEVVEPRTQIVQLLQQKSMSGSELLVAIKGMEESKIKESLRRLIDEEIVHIDQDLKFFV